MKYILALLLIPMTLFADTVGQEILDNQRQMLQIQQQQLNILQQSQFDYWTAQRDAGRRDKAETWAWFESLDSAKKKEIIDDWNKTRPDCPFPCPSRKRKE